MAYQVKYFCQWKDFLSLDWKIDFLTDPFAGTATELKATGNPLTIEHLSDSDEFNDPVRPSKATINVYSLTDFALVDFYSDEDFRIKVNIYKGAAGTSLYWTGFVTTSEYSEPYDQVPYPVQITAIDGLNYLKNILFDDAGAAYTGRMRQTYIILEILAKIQIAAFTEYVNTYEESMAVTADDSPIEQTIIDSVVFEEMYCYEVLQECLKIHNAVIRQVNGAMVVYRPLELLQATVYGRIYTGQTTKTSTNFAPLQYIKRSAHSSDLRQFPGSVLMIRPAMKNITLNQDYGNKQSWIKNYRLIQDSIHPTTSSVDSWSRGNSCIPYPMYFIDASQSEGMVIGSHNAYPTLNTYMYQSFAANAIATTDVVIFEFDYLIGNLSGSQIVNNDYYIEVKADGSNHWLYGLADGTADWDVSQNYIILTETVDPGSSGWLHFSRQVLGLPTDGAYTIKLFGSGSAEPDVYVAYKNIRFYSTTNSIYSLHPGLKMIRKRGGFITSARNRFEAIEVPVEEVLPVLTKIYNVTNALIGKDLENFYLLGDVEGTASDNVTEQFGGALVTMDGSFVYWPTSDWNTYTGTGGGRTSGAESVPLLEITGGEIGQQYSRPKQLIQMVIQEMDDSDTVLNLISHFEDDLNQVSAANRKFVFQSGEFNVKFRKWNCDLLEIIS